MDSKMNNITIKGITILVTKKNIKNIRLSVHPPDGQVRLVVPERMDDIDIDKLVMSKISWIEKHKSNFILKDKQLEKKFISGEEHLYLGSKYILKVLETSGKQYVELDNEMNLNLYVSSNIRIEKRKQLINDWYREQLKSLIPDYIDKWETIIGVKVEEFGVKLMKTL